MKIRNGFVSNSSSSSFIIYKHNLNCTQIYAIKNHINVAKEHKNYFNFGFVHDDDYWNIEDHNNYISGSVIMDNFSMHTFLIDFLKIDSNDIKWGDY